ncbi:UDP-N-acetylmuramoyl-tripeptide--D-alanyl-D-alanine ligase [Flavobacteriaceae bacterium]|nr:UDP-N-acetylmuramoyl-tripeptide--D-alanyl-D-alanine ligase [Flavobacteriaceae bacterium]|tara:strand:+ start:1649 stop:2902 length:1254 start_codon:yes stop_codon:yes gene_type:complete
MNIEDLYSVYSKNYLVDTDTRTIRPNSIFFSLKGDNFNGNIFAQKAIELGASYAIIDRKAHEIKGKTILVDNVLKTLQALANYHRKQLAIPIIGITGSNGKTTTKELLQAVLQTQFKTKATLGNLNNHIGVPLTILSFTNKTEIGIVEMGANHQKEIEFLCTICEPDLGYITNFGKAHLEGFGGIEGVIKGKSELYTYLKENNKTSFVNANDTLQVQLTTNLNSVLLNNTVTTSAIQPFLAVKYKDQVIHTHLVGAYNIDNLKAAISIGEYFTISQENIISGIKNYIPTNNRSQVIKKKNNTILMDAYNANPSSTIVALDNLNKTTYQKKTVILGDMFELGDYSTKEHQNIVDYCNTLHIDRCIFVGEAYSKTSASEKYENFESLKNQIKQSPFKNCYILIKGSRGMSLERLLEVID